MKTMYPLLAHSWSGLLVAAIVAALGASTMLLAQRLDRPLVRLARYAIFGVAILLGAGSAIAIIRATIATNRFPPPGRLVDVGGYRMHILAEGNANGGATLVWIPGSHAPGLDLYHLHKALRSATRSILFDRPGTGWSDIGPFPRTTAREAEELRTLLENAGEQGPFVLVGHSYGGLLAANFARRYPQRVAAVMLLDATPPDMFRYLPGGGGPDVAAGLVRDSERAGWRKLFGFGTDIDQPGGDRDERLADVRESLHALSVRAGPDFATASLFQEWTDPGSVAELVVYDQELADIPLFAIVPDHDESEIVRQLGLRGSIGQRATNFLAQARRRYLNTSTRSMLLRPPPGTGHDFPYEDPDFVIRIVRQVLLLAADESRWRDSAALNAGAAR